ncbi:hypothetical protein [Streptomyces afghaniensis]|uniref:hypothetical protein n=1 Tax=Streptomyces afghaniensis TaxID=66865 RepID=UPI0027D8EC7D|nr:hypothetical protein [Streptomyces afghaniensis]
MTQSEALDAKAISTPLDAHLPSPGLMLTLRRAEARLTNQCLARLGYASHPMPAPKAQPSRRHSEFLVFSIPQAEEVGYNPPKDAIEAGSSRWDAKASKVQRGLLDGSLRRYKGRSVPRTGCAGEAADRIAKGSRLPDKMEGGGIELTRDDKASPTGVGDAQVELMRLDAIVATKRDPRYLKMIRAWSSCMTKAGYEYKSPEDALNDVRWDGDEISNKERSTAVTDMRCKKDVHYLAVADAVQSEYEEEVIQKREKELTQLRRNLSVWEENAEEVIRSRSASTASS